MVAASTIAALTQLVSAASYYEQSNDSLESAQAHANVLANYYYYCGSSSYYNWSYDYYDSGCYDSYNTINWGWFFILLLCCPFIIYYKCCHRLNQSQEGDTTNIVYNDNNF